MCTVLFVIGKRWNILQVSLKGTQTNVPDCFSYLREKEG